MVLFRGLWSRGHLPTTSLVLLPEMSVCDAAHVADGSSQRLLRESLACSFRGRFRIVMHLRTELVRGSIQQFIYFLVRYL